MAYFSNGTEGDMYLEKYCYRCIHWTADSCPVWFLHQLHNYRDCNNAESMLHVLIPRSKDDHRNEQCSMFIRSPSMGLPLDYEDGEATKEAGE